MTAKCGKCDACELVRTGCGCVGALDDGCFLCRPEKHSRPRCPERAARVPRSDDCPHCHKSMWMGYDHPDGCQCRLPHEVICRQRFHGTPVSVTMPTTRAGYSDHHRGFEAEVEAKITRRVELFHFVRGLQFHLRCAEETLLKLGAEAAAPGGQDQGWPWPEGDGDAV